MKQKYLIFNSENENELVVRESAELDKGVYSVLLKETYDSQKMKSACEKDIATVIAAIRTNSFFPVSLCAERLAEAITEFYKAGGTESVEIQFDDLESLSSNKIAEIEEEAASDVELDVLLADGADKEDLLEEDDIKEISTKASPTLKVAEDNGVGQDEDP